MILILQNSYGLTLHKAELALKNHYQLILPSLSVQNTTAFNKVNSTWMNYRDLTCDFHRDVYDGNDQLCKTKLTFNHTLYIRLLLPNQNNLKDYFNHQVLDKLLAFQKSEVKNIGNTLEQNLHNKLEQSFTQLSKKLNNKDLLNYQKIYLAWEAYQDQMCRLLDNQSHIPYNICTTSLTLQMIQEMRNYISDDYVQKL